MPITLSQYVTLADQPSRASADRCLLWRRAFDAEGYPRLRIGGKQRYAHRFLFEILYRPLEDGERVYRTCGRRSCVSAKHLTTKPTPPKRDRGRPASTKLTRRKVQNIRKAWALPEDERPTQQELAQKYSVSRSCISLVVRKATWSDV